MNLEPTNPSALVEAVAFWRDRWAVAQPIRVADALWTSTGPGLRTFLAAAYLLDEGCDKETAFANAPTLADAGPAQDGRFRGYLVWLVPSLDIGDVYTTNAEAGLPDGSRFASIDGRLGAVQVGNHALSVNFAEGVTIEALPVALFTG